MPVSSRWGCTLHTSCRLAAVVWLVVMSSAMCAFSQVGVPLNRSDFNLEPAKVRELVAQYCRADFGGARLNPSDWPKLQPVVWWKENPDYAGFAVISRFDVDPSAVPERNKYTVGVRYRILGSFNLAE